jgi:hypothetical protein
VEEGLNAMMSTSVELGLFSGFQVGHNMVFRVPHLQYTVDTLIVVEKT